MKQEQISKEEFRRTEGLLYRYFEQPKEIETIQNHIALLKEQAEELEERIKETDVSLDTYANMGIDYSRDKIQTSSQGSYAESETCRQIQKLEDRKNEKNRNINELMNEIQDIQENNQIIHDNLKMLSDEKLKMIEAKYRDKLVLSDLLDKIHMSRSAWFDNRKKLIENIAQWFEFTKT